MTDNPEAALNTTALALKTMHDEIAGYLQSQGDTAAASSRAGVELRTFRPPEAIVTANAQGGIALTTAADHLDAVAMMFASGSHSIAPWACARAALESCAIGGWLCDPNSTATARVQRSFAWRYEGLNQQRIICQALGESEELRKIETRVKKVEQQAIELGFQRVLDKKNRRIGIGQLMPSMTDLAKNVLHEEFIYRLTSAMAHGQSWALQNISFARTGAQYIVDGTTPGVNVHMFQKQAAPGAAILICVKVAQLYAKVIWWRTVLFGMDQQPLATILESAYLAMKMRDDLRFWTMS